MAGGQRAIGHGMPEPDDSKHPAPISPPHPLDPPTLTHRIVRKRWRTGEGGVRRAGGLVGCTPSVFLTTARPGCLVLVRPQPVGLLGLACAHKPDPRWDNPLPRETRGLAPPAAVSTARASEEQEVVPVEVLLYHRPWALPPPTAQTVDRVTLRVHPVEPWRDAARGYHLPGKADDHVTRAHRTGSIHER